VAHCPRVRSRIVETHILEHQTLSDRNRDRAGIRPASYPRLEREKAEQVVQVETLLEHLRKRKGDSLNQIPALTKGAGKKREHANSEQAGRPPVADHGEVDDYNVGAVVPQRPYRSEKARYDAPTYGQGFVRFIELSTQSVVTTDQEIREPEELYLLGRDVARPRIAQVVEQSPLGRP